MKYTNTEFDRRNKIGGYSPTEVCDLFDTNPNLTMAELSDITGFTIAQLKRILMGASR